MIVYHGGLEIIKKPDVAHSYRRLDFGKGFYVTTVRVQAEKWARRKANISDRDFAIVNQYALCENFGDFRVKSFQEDLGDWIDFVCACRDGKVERLWSAVNCNARTAVESDAGRA